MASRHIVVKVGSQVLCDESGALDLGVLSGIAGQIARLHRDGWKVLLVSSGAVAAGQAAVTPDASRLQDPVVRKQVLAAAGQVELMLAWRRQLGEVGLRPAQVLASRSDFQTRHHYLNMRGCISALVDIGMVPVINENDVVSVTELMFTDNDELAGLLATMVDADLLCLLSSVPGVYDGDPDDDATRRIEVWDESARSAEDVVQQASSSLGRGGMHSKLNVARETARLGTEVVIADGGAPEVLLRIAAGENVGTRFIAGTATSSTRRWLASAKHYTTASVHVNEGAAAALSAHNRLASLLPVGIDRIEGEFKRGDVVQVLGPDGQVIACGKAQYDADDARAAIGLQGQKPLVHYDYLYLVARTEGRPHD